MSPSVHPLLTHIVDGIRVHRLAQLLPHPAHRVHLERLEAQAHLVQVHRFGHLDRFLLQLVLLPQANFPVHLNGPLPFDLLAQLLGDVLLGGVDDSHALEHGHVPGLGVHLDVVRIYQIDFTTLDDQVVRVGGPLGRVDLEQRAANLGFTLEATQLNGRECFLALFRVNAHEGTVRAVHLRLVPKAELVHRLLQDDQVRHGQLDLGMIGRCKIK